MNKILPYISLILAVIAVGFFALKQPTVIEIKDGNVASVTSPDINSPYFSYGDIRHWGAKDTDMTDASTTVCALLSPAATSTLDFGSVKFTTGATTTQTITMGKGSTQYVISTILATSSATANEQKTMTHASTTQATSNLPTVITDKIFSPSTYLIVQLSSANAYTNVEGICEATWIEN